MLHRLVNKQTEEYVPQPKLKHQDSAPTESKQPKVDTQSASRPEPTAKTPQPVNTASPNMAHAVPFQMPPPMHGLPPNMMHMSIPFMGQMVMMPQMGMRPPFMMHAPMHPQGFPPHPGMHNPVRPEMGENKQEPGQSGPAQAKPVSTTPLPATSIK